MINQEQTKNHSAAPEWIVLGMFSGLLVACVVLDISLVLALLTGYGLFFGYALYKGLHAKEILKVSLSGILTIKNILITFLLIGVLTGLWRACGTIAAIVEYSASLIQPSVMVLLTFLLNCLISMLTGTAFGTAATMGTICMTMALTMNLNPLHIGGAILAGAYFGDRCSPVSTSALLLAELTGTDIYENIKGMLKSAAIPFAVSAILYFLLGKRSNGGAAVSTELLQSFGQQFRLGLLPLLPAILIFVLAICKVNVKLSMAVSILAAALIGIFYQKLGIGELLRFAAFGYTSELPELAPLIDGGGISSMVRVFLIVCISSCYSGIFEATGLLHPVQAIINRLAQKCSAVTVMIPVSVVIGMIACNQTLTIMLTNQVCRQLEPDNKKFALHLENTAVVLAPLVPWSIAGAVPLSTCGAPPEARLFAFFLFLLPFCSIR